MSGYPGFSPTGHGRLSGTSPSERLHGGGHYEYDYNPYAPPTTHTMNQANMCRAKFHTLGPTFSDEEDGDDSEFIRERMRALGLSDEDVYGQASHLKAAYRARNPAQTNTQKPIADPYAEAPPHYSAPMNGGPRADPGYRKYGEGDPATNRSHCPYPEIASYAQNQRMLQSSDLMIQMEMQARAQASARAQLEAMRFQAQMQQYVQQDQHSSMPYKEQSKMDGSDDEDEAELLRKLQAIREAKIRKQKSLAILNGSIKEKPTPALSATAEPWSPTTASDLSLPPISPIEPKASPVEATVPPPSAISGRFAEAQAQQPASDASQTLMALLARRTQATRASDALGPSPNASLPPSSRSSDVDEVRAEERRKARAGLSALGNGRPTRSREATITPPEPTVPAGMPCMRTTSQPVSPIGAKPTDPTPDPLAMQKRVASQPFLTVPTADALKPVARVVSAPMVRIIRQPNGPPVEAELEAKNFVFMKRRRAGAALGMLGRRKVENELGVAAGADKIAKIEKNDK